MENDDLLGSETAEDVVEPSTEEVVAPVVPDADESPVVNTEGAKSVAEAIDFGLGEVEARRQPKVVKPDETPEEKTAREAADAARPRNADGTFKTDEQIAADKLATGTAAPEDEAAKKAKAEKDAVEAEIPATAAPKTKERMQTLIDLVKDKDSQIGQHQAFVNQIAATGATPQEFNTMMSYMSAVHSDNPEHLRLAQKLLMSELEGISLKLGEAAPGIDFLAKYPDLQAQVARGEIRREAAQELALTRTRVAAAQAEKDGARQRTATETAAKAERDAAQAELTTLGDDLFKRDGAEYQRKYAILEPALEALGMLHPSKWKAAFLAAYNKIPAPAPTLPNPSAGKAPTAAAPAAPKGQPLRTNKTPGGESSAGPKSLLEAITRAVDGV